MSQAATLYRITQQDFLIIEAANGKNINPSDFTNRYVIFESSFMALEYVLAKGLNQREINLVKEIFTPSYNIGAADMSDVDFQNLSEEEMWSILDTVDYIPAEKVIDINAILHKISENDIARNYDAEELNENGIYPGAWQNGDVDNILNRKYILNEFNVLKTFFREAAEAKDLILSYVG